MKRKLKLWHFIVLAVVMFLLLCTTVSAADSEIILGDMNGDSVVDINDAIYLLKHTMMPSRYPVSQPADVNGTSDVNIDDAIYLLKHTMMPSRYPITIPGTYYTITWKNNDGTVLKTTLCEEDKTPSFGDEIPTKESDSQYSYTFSGWATELVAATEDATYVATYTKSTRTSYTISYNANGGVNVPPSQSKNKGQGISINLSSSIPTNEGKIFIGWICANDGKVYKAGASFNIDADVTLYAVWGHDCSTCLGSGTTPTTIDCSRCDGKGYTTSTYEYWDYCDNGCSSGRLYRWVDCYSCKNAGGFATAFCTACSGAGSIRESYTCPVCSGTGGCYQTGTKKSLCQSCDESGKVPSTKTCTTCNGDKTVADSYSSYTVTLKNQNSTVGTESVTVNSPYKLSVPTRKGYTFIGWFDAEENGTQYTDGEGVCLSVWSESGNKTLYAHWSLNYYTITYDCDEDVDLSGMPTLYTVEDEDIALNKQYENHQTVSWNLNNVTIASVDTSIAKNIIIKGVWTSAACAPVRENLVEVTTCVDGIYDSVIYCEGCGEELSRETITVPAPHNLKNGICTLCDYEYFSSNLKFTSNGNNTCYVSGIGGCTDTDIYIPRVSPTGDVVTSIGSGAFKDCTTLKSIKVPDSVTSIGSQAFDNCKNLTNIILSDSITRIGSYAFYGCSGLGSIEIPDGVTIISAYMFHGCTGLTRVTIPDSIKFIEELAFSWCKGLTNITIPDGVTIIEADAFMGCSGLKNITIPDSVTYIGPGVLDYCSALTTITIPFVGDAENEPSYTNLGYIFGTGSKNYLDSVPSSVQTVVVTGGIIGYEAFYRCNELTSVILLDGVKGIDSAAFAGCTELANIIIPDSVEFIGISGLDDTAFYKNESNWQNGTLYIGNHLIKTDSTLSGDYVIKDGTKTIAGEAFDGCSSLTGITIPDSVMYIGPNSFSACSKLKNITVPDSVTRIGRQAFSDCRGLECITLSKNITSIPEYAFSYCSSLKNVTIPDGVTLIGFGSFNGCKNLESIIIPDSVMSIDADALARCTSLNSIKYKGSALQWSTISKGYFWNDDTGAYTITYNYKDE